MLSRNETMSEHRSEVVGRKRVGSSGSPNRNGKPDRSDRQDRLRRARLFKALGHESRLLILELLVNDELCVCELAEATGLDQSTVSKHLALLAGSRLVESERRGHHVYYRPTSEWVIELLSARPRALGETE